MITIEEKKLLDFVYGQAENLIDFMKRNGYTKEKMVGYSVTIGYEYDGDTFDRNDASFCNVNEAGKPVRSVTRTYNHYTDKSDYDETIFKRGRKNE